MKKFITLLTSISFVGSINVNVVSCKNKSIQIQLIMDGKGSVDDNSFNQLTWDGVKRFGKDNKKTTDHFNPKDIGWNTESERFQQYQEYRNSYKNAFNNKTEIVVANGFYHSVSVTDFALKNSKKPFVLVDAELDRNRNSEEIKHIANVASLLFRSEQASFVAGIIACAYLNEEKEIFLKDKTTLNLGSFGGGNFSSVVNYMAGLHASLIWWNKHIADDEGKNIMQLIYPDFETSETILPVNDVTFHDDKAFSGSFLKDGKGKAKAKQLIDAGADIIMPVAGIQTEDVLEVIGTELKNRTVNVIGVDSDQKKLYNNKNIIISALKNLDTATYQSLNVWYNEKNSEEEKKWFHGSKPILKGLIAENGEKEDWVGVVSDDVTNDQVSTLIDKLSPAIQTVTTWWNKINNKEDLWSVVVKEMNDKMFD